MTINDYSTKNVEITSLYFRYHRDNDKLESYPKRMVLDGQEYTFLNDSLRFLIKRGQHLIKLFDVTDGDNSYRLRWDDSDSWSLVETK